MRGWGTTLAVTFFYVFFFCSATAPEPAHDVLVWFRSVIYMRRSRPPLSCESPIFLHAMTATVAEDLVDPGMFLRGCREPLIQYQECLMKNLKDWSGRYGDCSRNIKYYGTWYSV